MSLRRERKHGISRERDGEGRFPLGSSWKGRESRDEQCADGERWRMCCLGLGFQHGERSVTPAEGFGGGRDAAFRTGGIHLLGKWRRRGGRGAEVIGEGEEPPWESGE